MTDHLFHWVSHDGKDEQPLRNIELQVKEDKNKIIEESCLQRTQGKNVPINSRLKLFRL